jgi:hypothetical protein
MPKLLHLNGLDNKINKRIVKHMIKQATEQLPDVPAPAISEDVTQNYISLMKSLSFIILNMDENQMRRFGYVPEGEAGSEGEFEEYQFGDGGSEASYASFGIPGGSSEGSAYGSEIANPRINPPYPLRSPSQSERLSQYPEPRRPEQSMESLIYNNNAFLDISGLSKEIINAEYLVEVIPFSQLTKIQKQKLKQKIVQLNTKGRILNRGATMPIYRRLQSLIRTINSQLKKGGEGDSSEFLPRTEEEMPPEEVGVFGAGHICGSTTSVYGAARKHRLLSPAMYLLHNPSDVNANFAYSLAKRNL